MQAEVLAEDETETEEPMLCETCSAVLTDAEIDDFGGDTCQACYAKTHFHCLACESDCELDDQSPRNKSLCLSCQESKDEEIAGERLTAAKEAAQEAFDAILDGDDLDVVLKAVAALRRLAK
jgi:hypothetical protein